MYDVVYEVRYMPSRPTALTAAAGEHYVAYQLAKRGFIVGLTRGGTQLVDSIVSNQKGDKSISLQVKTKDNAYERINGKPEESRWAWFVGKKAFGKKGDRFLYAFVDMKGSARELPSVFIVPSNDVVNFLGPNPEDWSIPSFRIYLNKKDKYLERWDIIEKLLK